MIAFHASQVAIQRESWGYVVAWRLEKPGLTVELWYFDVPADKRWRRLEARNLSLPVGTFEITREMFDLFESWVEPPDADEHVRIVGADEREDASGLGK